MSFERFLPGHRGLWLAFFAAVLAAWSLLFVMQAAAPTDVGWQAGGIGYLLSICTLPASSAGYPATLAMWALMSMAMMAPTAFPAFRTYADLTRTDAAGAVSFAALIGGYMSVWLGFSIVAAYLQMLLAGAGLLQDDGRSGSALLSGALLLIAGLYQFSSLKNACLSACQSPMAFFLGHWQPGLNGAVRLGLRLGAVCLGCCWALMLLAFVAGTMNLVFMGLAMVLMTLEKLPDIGGKLSMPLGVFLCMSGAVVTVLSLTTS